MENIMEARQGFLQLTEAALPESVDVWKGSIEEAEESRSGSPHTIDIMHSKIKTGRTLKAIIAAVMQEDLDAKLQSADTLGITDWILQGLQIEDEQVNIPFVVRACKLNCGLGFAFGNWFGRPDGIQHRMKRLTLLRNGNE
jgi:hypothetical protein